MDDVLLEFLDEARAHLGAAAGDLARLRRGPDEPARLGLLRRLHTLKGTASFLDVPRLAALAHAAEAGLGEAHPGEEALAGTAAALRRMGSLVGDTARNGREPAGDDADLIAHLAALGTAADHAPCEAELAPLMGPLRDLMDACAHLAAAVERAGGAPAPVLVLQDAAEAMEHGAAAPTEPVGHAFARLPRLASRLETILGKPLDLTLSGEDVTAAPRTLAALRDALPHLVRNAADHGIEPAAARAAAGKPERGRITVAARRYGDGITVSVEDDGAGLDPEAIGRAAGAAASPLEAAGLVLRPGLTTARAPTLVSGRGIGLDAVRALVEELGGAVEITSAPGQGTRCTLTLPRTSPSTALTAPARLRPALLA